MTLTYGAIVAARNSSQMAWTVSGWRNFSMA